jgi:hypothetical protein
VIFSTPVGLCEVEVKWLLHQNTFLTFVKISNAINIHLTAVLQVSKKVKESTECLTQTGKKVFPKLAI